MKLLRRPANDLPPEQELELIEARLVEAEQEERDARAEREAALAERAEAEQLDADSFFGTADPAAAQRARADGERRVVEAGRRYDDAKRRVEHGKRRRHQLRDLIRDDQVAAIETQLDELRELERRHLNGARAAQALIAEKEAQRDEVYFGSPSDDEIREAFQRALRSGELPSRRSLRREVEKRLAAHAASADAQRQAASDAFLGVRRPDGSPAYARIPTGNELRPVRLT
jgi:hypothetical protein